MTRKCQFGVRWQAQRDTALDQLDHDHDPKRRRRFALPAHSKIVLIVFLLTAHCSLLTSFAQPGVPQPNSPLYGGSVRSGDVSTGLPPVLKKVGIDQKLNEQLPLDAVFKDEQGNEVRLGEFFKGKPVVIALVYYTCPMLCNQVMNGMLGSFRQTSLNVGEDFEVVTVSFDTKDTPAIAAAKKKTYIAGYNRPSGDAGWHFLTGDDANIKRLADAVGFRYTWDEQTKQFAHASGIMIATPEGKLARYFYGIEYPPRDMRLALVEASANKIGTPVDALMLYCYHYDPATGKYGVVIMNVIRVAGIITLVLIVSLLLLLRRVTRRRQFAVSEARP
ncbi:MAG TPA: SCO family protein [Pyrinomonadaceae bacterium]|nr:SCO family protein [Pyrinomonadaceae bacterium]